MWDDTWAAPHPTPQKQVLVNNNEYTKKRISMFSFPFSFRRRILAKQLGDFVRVYGKVKYGKQLNFLNLILKIRKLFIIKSSLQYQYVKQATGGYLNWPTTKFSELTFKEMYCSEENLYFNLVSAELFLFIQQETMQIQKRQEINRAYGLSRSNSFTGEIPDEEFKVFMAIARYPVYWFICSCW